MVVAASSLRTRRNSSTFRCRCCSKSLASLVEGMSGRVVDDDDDDDDDDDSDDDDDEASVAAPSDKPS